MVGVGAMGSALLERLRLADVRPTVYDVAPAALERARGLGAEAADSSATVARAATIVDVVVRSDQDVQDSVLGPRGVLEGARPDTLVLLHSTILPQTTRAVAAAASARGVHVLDACMVGVPSVVRAGNLSFVVGGPPELVERARPHLLNMSRQVLHMGPLGAGNAAKLIKNLVTGAETLVIHEAIQIGEAAGIPYRDALEMMRQVYSGTILDRWQGVFDPAGAGPTPRVGNNMFDKDIPLAAQLARDLRVDVPITEQLLAAGQRLLAQKTAAASAGDGSASRS